MGNYVEFKVRESDIDKKFDVSCKNNPFVNTLVSLVYLDEDGNSIDGPITTGNGNKIGVNCFPYIKSDEFFFIAGTQEQTTLVWRQGRTIASERHVDAISIRDWPTTPVDSILVRVTQF